MDDREYDVIKHHPGIGCDSTDAMRSSRSYRKGMTDCDCRREIEKNAGTMYDPELASLCLSNWDFLTGDLYVNII